MGAPGYRDVFGRRAVVIDGGRCSSMYGPDWTVIDDQTHSPSSVPPSPSLESLMADINTTLETLTARIDQMVADLKATNPTPAPAPPARTRWTFETEWRVPVEGERWLSDSHIGIYPGDGCIDKHATLVTPITAVDP